VGHAYFLRGRNDEASPVLAHLLRAVRTGRVEADPISRTLVLE